MNFTFEYIFINFELNEIKNNINQTIKNFVKKYGISFWEHLDYEYNIRFFDKMKNKTKNITTSRGPNRSIVASNLGHEFIEIN